MDFNKAYNNIMSEQMEIALATCVEGRPNVRVVNFCCKKDRKGIIYFSSFNDNPKVEEFIKNASVAFTTIPHEGNAHVRVKDGIVKRSNLTIYDLKEEFINKIPDYAKTIEHAGEFLILYEIQFDQAIVTVDLENSSCILV